MIDKSKPMDRSAMKLPRPSPGRMWLREAIALSLGYKTFSDIDSHPTEAYVRIMSAIASEEEQLIRERKLVPQAEALSADEREFLRKYREASVQEQATIDRRLEPYGRQAGEAERQTGGGERRGHESA